MHYRYDYMDYDNRQTSKCLIPHLNFQLQWTNKTGLPEATKVSSEAGCGQVGLGVRQGFNVVFT